MKRILIFVLIGFMVVLFSVKKPVENAQPKTIIVKQQNIGLPNNVVKELNKLINP